MHKPAPPLPSPGEGLARSLSLPTICPLRQTARAENHAAWAWNARTLRSCTRAPSTHTRTHVGKHAYTHMETMQQRVRHSFCPCTHGACPVLLTRAAPGCLPPSPQRICATAVFVAYSKLPRLPGSKYSPSPAIPPALSDAPGANDAESDPVRTLLTGRPVGHFKHPMAGSKYAPPASALASQVSAAAAGGDQGGDAVRQLLASQPLGHFRQPMAGSKYTPRPPTQWGFEEDEEVDVMLPMPPSSAAPAAVQAAGVGAGAGPETAADPTTAAARCAAALAGAAAEGSAAAAKAAVDAARRGDAAVARMSAADAATLAATAAEDAATAAAAAQEAGGAGPQVAEMAQGYAVAAKASADEAAAAAAAQQMQLGGSADAAAQDPAASPASSVRTIGGWKYVPTLPTTWGPAAGARLRTASQLMPSFAAAAMVTDQPVRSGQPGAAGREGAAAQARKRRGPKTPVRLLMDLLWGEPKGGSSAAASSGSLTPLSSSSSSTPGYVEEGMRLEGEGAKLASDEAWLAGEGSRLAGGLASQEARLLAAADGSGAQVVRLFGASGSPLDDELRAAVLRAGAQALPLDLERVAGVGVVGGGGRCCLGKGGRVRARGACMMAHMLCVSSAVSAHTFSVMVHFR